MTDLPLDGIRVLDLTVVWAGTHATQLLSEWGAEVIRVEPRTAIQSSTRGAERQPPSPAVLRALAATGVSIDGFPDFDGGDDPWNRSAAFNSHARNKKSVTGDVMTPEGRELFLRLAEVSDVIVENNVPETIEKAHLTYEEVRARNPRIIMLRMPGFGLTGPYKNYRGFGLHMEAMVGHTYLRSYPDETTGAAGTSVTGDAIAGVTGAFAVAMALRHRRRTGLGQQIELPQAETFLPVLGEFILERTANGRTVEPQGNSHRWRAPHGYYHCRAHPEWGDDMWIGIDCDSDDAWLALCGVLGAESLFLDDRFSTATRRHRHRAELDGLLTAYTREWDVQALFLSLQAAGVIAGPVQNEAMAYRCAQLAQRGFFEELTSTYTGTHRYPGLVFRMRNTPNALRTPAPGLGEHNDEVYRDLLGYTAEEYQALQDSQLVGRDYAPGVVPGR